MQEEEGDTCRYAWIEFSTSNQASTLEIFRIDIGTKFMLLVTFPSNILFADI
jgi:hypothetical protein